MGYDIDSLTIHNCGENSVCLDVNSEINSGEDMVGTEDIEAIFV